MSIYFALEYDANGVSRIVEKKDTSTRAITQRDFNIGSYVGNQITSPENPTEPVKDNTMDDFISQMGTGTMGDRDEMDSFQRFIDRGNLRAFMDEGKGPKDTKFVNAIFTALGVPVTAEGITKFFDSIGRMLPQESAEVKRIRKFYATEGLKYMNPNNPNYIPGLENYNIVYGDPRKPDSGLQNVITKRMSTIANTLSNASYMSKYGLDRGLTSREIQAIIDGTYAGPETPLTKRYKNLNDVATLEFNFKYDDDKKDDDKLIDTKDKIDFENIDTGIDDFSSIQATPVSEYTDRQRKDMERKQAEQKRRDDAARDRANQQYRDDPSAKSYSGGFDRTTGNYDDPFAPGDAD
tara:strand:+ start:88 stop:1140 length:1053 start_codon:yes stop_codon:yes gene_type:complete